MLLGAVAIAGNRLQTSTIRGGNQGTHILSHPPIVSQLSLNVKSFKCLGAIGAMIAASFIVGLIWNALFGIALPSYLGGVIGGLAALLVWGMLVRGAPKADDDRRRKSDTRPLMFAIAGTVLILTAVTALMIWKWDTVGNLELNQIGDAVAGFASLLAFMWLIATILLQYRELQIQRQDVEMMAQAQLEQANQMRQQAKEMGDQTQISMAGYQQAVQNFESLKKKRAKERQEDLAHDIVALMVLSIIPSLKNSAKFLEAIQEDSGELESARIFFDARRDTESLTVLFNFLARLSISSDADRDLILKELSGTPLMHERILLLRTLFGAMQQFDNTIDMMALSASASMVEMRLDWLLDAADVFPSATDQMRASFKKGIDELKKLDDNFRRNARRLLDDDPNAGAGTDA